MYLDVLKTCFFSCHTSNLCFTAENPSQNRRYHKKWHAILPIYSATQNILIPIVVGYLRHATNGLLLVIILCMHCSFLNDLNRVWLLLEQRGLCTRAQSPIEP